MSNQSVASFVGENRISGELLVGNSTDSFREGTVWEMPDRATADQMASVMNQLRAVGLGLVRRCGAIDSPLQAELAELEKRARRWELARDGTMVAPD